MYKKFTANERAAKCLLPLETALFRACSDVRGTTGAIAEIYGLNQNTFALKLNPARATHHLNPNEIEMIIQQTRDPRIMDSICHAFSNDQTTAFWFEIPTDDHIENTDLLQQYSDLIEKSGRFGKVLFDALQDGIMNDDEIAAIEKSQREYNGCLAALVNRAKQMRDLQQ
jgi:hypothetical protein